MSKKRYLLSIIIVIIITCFVGCDSLSVLEAYKNYQQGQEKIYVAFSKEGEENDPIDYQEIADYQSVYSNYNSRMMYNTLSPAEQKIYRIFEYALDKEYTTIFFDSRLIEEAELSPEDVMRLYSVDSPMVQQNFTWTASETSYTYSYFGKLFSFEVSGEEFYIENFSHDAMEKKKKALAVAKEIFKTMPQNLSQIEQARFFFRFLTREVKYIDNKEDPGKQNNLYDALVIRKTQCDGYANAFSLLCSMAKITCAEKLVSPKKEGEVGHTWNVFCADGIWYNADLSLNEEYAKLHKTMNVDFSFGFSDAKNDEVSDFAERFPKCTADLIPLDFMANSASDSKLLPNLKAVFKKSGKRFAYIGLKKGELKNSDLQRIANYLGFDIVALDETINGKYYYYIFKD